MAEIYDYKELIENCEEWIAKADNFGADDLANCISACADAIEQLVKERDEWMKSAKQERKRSIERYHELAVELDRVKKERDTAVADLKEGSFCMNCKHLVSTKEEKPCRHCSSLTGGGEDNWEWRGERSETDVR